MGSSKVNIKLTPYNAVTLFAFLREYINDNLVDEKRECHDKIENWVQCLNCGKFIDAELIKLAYE